MSDEEIFQLLTQEYTLSLATTPTDFDEVKRLRREIFAPKFSMSPDILEQKGYLFSKDDIQSFTYLLHHTESDHYVGTVRIFFINSRTPEQRLPMQRDGNVNDIDAFTKEKQICEISRFALSPNLPKHSHLSALQLSTYLSMALMIAIRLNCFLYRYKMVFAAMERSLQLILKRQNAYFKVIGENTQYYGTRTPFAINTKQLLKDTNHKGGNITQFYLKKLCKDPKDFWHFIDNNPYIERSDIELDRLCKLFEIHGDNVPLDLLLGEETKKATLS